ncbi:WG repeat-containing protein [Sinomicrobium pectinilyticum]|uniref:WG repeat-containing protein n=1 Tax=Sinomicrobium pectinilyticum TaxID=1084421 RepID=A0A3N0EC10_SINP1|nr:WG repeat-containing protein [Sinomicrobium pectinilyticum]RNL85382.1 WG repeat-containing protein [Sinomicrobium pectinilyticum]
MKKLVIWMLLLSGISLSAQHISDISGIGKLSDGLIAIEKNGEWGFINPDGELVIGFRQDIVVRESAPVFSEGLCLIEETREGIAYYGYMDNTGKTVIPPVFLNATPFDNGLAFAIVTSKSVRGKNQYLDMDIVVNEFDEVAINPKGEIIAYLGQRKGVLLTKKRYKQPQIEAQLLSPRLAGVKNKNGTWNIYKF